MSRFIYVLCLVCVLTFGAMAIAAEPNVEIAKGWWPPMENDWTPVGWKDHLFRYNVLFTGDVLSEPHPCLWHPKEHTTPYTGLGVQLTIRPVPDKTIPPAMGWSYVPIDHKDWYRLTDASGNRFGEQGWTNNATPVLWTRWRQPVPTLAGMWFKEEMFGHIPGGGDVETGIEPLFGWIRLKVEKVHPALKQSTVSYQLNPDGTRSKVPIIGGSGRTCGFLIKVNARHLYFSSYKQENTVVVPDNSRYPRELKFEELEGKGGMLVESDGKVRLAVMPNQAAAVTFTDRDENGKDYYLCIEMVLTEGYYVDVLLPAVPTERGIVEKEIALGYDGALAESDKYWSKKPATAANVDVPEAYINECIKANVKLAEVVAEKNPETGVYSTLLGSLVFANTWATPTTMSFHMALDPLGYHDMVGKYLKIYKDAQGVKEGPGPSYGKHPGYLCSPPSVSSIDWITDHGAILHSMATHGLLSDDKEFIAEYTDTIVKGCDFIKDSRAKTEHGGVEGLMPPATATDDMVAQQCVWADGWSYKGLTSAVRLLKRIGHPRAEEFAKEAADYKVAFVKALRAKTLEMPTWTDKQGKSHHIVPYAMQGYWGGTEICTLDAGSLFLVYAGLMDADDELMRDSLNFFRDGPNKEFYNPNGQQLQPPVLEHEISIHEPCYSWNVHHSWQLGDREKFLEGMYSLFVGGMSQETFISAESRHGESGLTASFALAMHHARLAVIDDMIEPGNLHLLRLVPLAWIKTDYLTKFENMPTEFGPVTLKFKLSKDGKALEVTYEPAFRYQPKKVVLHVPPVEGLKKIIINGKSKRVKAGGIIEIK